MVESVLEIGKRTTRRRILPAMWWEFSMVNIPPRQTIICKKRTNSYKILPIVYNYYPIKLDPEREES
jgi:hypothetical protein